MFTKHCLKPSSPKSAYFSKTPYTTLCCLSATLSVFAAYLFKIEAARDAVIRQATCRPVQQARAP
jgi:hypothetical protein